MSEDDFRKNVYEVLKAVEAKTMSISIAQRRIMRLARRANTACTGLAKTSGENEITAEDEAPFFQEEHI